MSKPLTVRPDPDSATTTQRDSRATRREVTTLGLVMGVVMWFLLFGLAFTRPVTAYRRDALLPLLLFAGLALGFGLWRPKQWAWAAAALSLPTVIIGSLFCFSVVAEGDGFEPEYFLEMAGVAVAAFSGTGLGRLLTSFGGPNKSLERSRDR